jgi:hypothetical protein
LIFRVFGAAAGALAFGFSPFVLLSVPAGFGLAEGVRRLIDRGPSLSDIFVNTALAAEKVLGEITSEMGVAMGRQLVIHERYRTALEGSDSGLQAKLNYQLYEVDDELQRLKQRAAELGSFLTNDFASIAAQYINSTHWHNGRELGELGRAFGSRFDDMFGSVYSSGQQPGTHAPSSTPRLVPAVDR